MATPIEKMADIRVAIERDAEIAAAKVMRLAAIHEHQQRRGAESIPNHGESLGDEKASVHTR